MMLESTSVLKDDSCQLYLWFRAAFGVILITTKSKGGKLASLFRNARYASISTICRI